MNSLLLANVADPTDFPENSAAPGLRSLDASLRCTICGELYDAPVTLQCGHCFCSVCLRTSLVEKQECPACRKVANDGHLRPNPAMEEAVSAWKQSRPYILKLSKEDEQRKTTPIPPETPKQKRRRIEVETPQARFTASRTSSSTSATGSTPLRPKRSREPSSEDFDTIPSSDVDEQEVTLNPQPEDLVACPLCSKKVKHKAINQHIDKGCKDPVPIRSSAQSDWMKIMSGSKKGKQKEGASDGEDDYRLPKASYGTLKDKQLKEMLTEQKLPTSGDRNTLIQRHQRWVMIYNSNLDRSKEHRKMKSDLRKELKKWEEERSRRKKFVVEDTVSHEKRHKDEFAKLVAAARESKKPLSAITVVGDTAARTKPEDNEGEERPRTRPQSTTPQLQVPPEDVIVVDSEEERHCYN